MSQDVPLDQLALWSEVGVCLDGISADDMVFVLGRGLAADDGSAVDVTGRVVGRCAVRCDERVHITEVTTAQREQVPNYLLHPACDTAVAGHLRAQPGWTSAHVVFLSRSSALCSLLTELPQRTLVLVDCHELGGGALARDLATPDTPAFLDRFGGLSPRTQAILLGRADVVTSVQRQALLREQSLSRVRLTREWLDEFRVWSARRERGRMAEVNALCAIALSIVDLVRFGSSHEAAPHEVLAALRSHSADLPHGLLDPVEDQVLAMCGLVDALGARGRSQLAERRALRLLREHASEACTALLTVLRDHVHLPERLPSQHPPGSGDSRG